MTSKININGMKILHDGKNLTINGKPVVEKEKEFEVKSEASANVAIMAGFILGILATFIAIGFFGTPLC